MSLQNPDTPPATSASSDAQQSFLDARKDAPSKEDIKEEDDPEMLPLVDSSDEEPMSAEPASSSTAPRRERAKRKETSKELRADVTVSEETADAKESSNPLAKALKKQKITGKGGRFGK